MLSFKQWLVEGRPSSPINTEYKSKLVNKTQTESHSENPQIKKISLKQLRDRIKSKTDLTK